ncbi:MAG: ParA family protein, partial [Brevinema sp.]
MSNIISLFNHKGGVSKTTTTYHLGWMLATLG